MRVADICRWQYESYTFDEISKTSVLDEVKNISYHQRNVIIYLEHKIKTIDILGLIAGKHQLASSPLGFSQELLQKAREDNALLIEQNAKLEVDFGETLQERFAWARERDKLLSEIKDLKATNVALQEQVNKNKRKLKVSFAETTFIKEDRPTKNLLAESLEKQDLQDVQSLIKKASEVSLPEMIEAYSVDVDPWESHKDIIDLSKINRRSDFEIKFMKTLIEITIIDQSSQIKPMLLVETIKERMVTGLSLKDRIQRVLKRCLKIPINMRNGSIKGITLNPKVLEEMKNDTAEIENFFTKPARRSLKGVS